MMLIALISLRSLPFVRVGARGTEGKVAGGAGASDRAGTLARGIRLNLLNVASIKRARQEGTRTEGIVRRRGGAPARTVLAGSA